MKIVLFINNYSMENVDISSLLDGNPGIGGTQYEMFLLAKLMLDKQENNEFIVALTHKQKGFDHKNIVVLNEFDEVFSYCNENNVDVLVMRENNKFNQINSLKKTKVVFWVHNFISYEMVKKIGSLEAIKRVVFVSKQHYDFYLEYNLNKKATYVYNALPFPESVPSIQNKENNVVFTGNIVPIKRLHLVTRIWPYIKKKVPDATLLVIGTGANAHRDAKLGPYNIAEEKYEKVILEPLIKTNTLESVKFLGILGTEKNDVIQTAKVGISPNKDETFCLSAAEYILNGVPVAGVAKGGINDVVMNKKTGVLHRNLNRIRNDVIKILQDKKTLTINDDSIMAMKEKFGFEPFLKSWEQTISDVFYDVPAKKLKASKPFIDKAKWAGCVFRFFRKVFHLPEAFTRLGLYRVLKRK